jgi:hypothetical protein
VLSVLTLAISNFVARFSTTSTGFTFKSSRACKSRFACALFIASGNNLPKPANGQPARREQLLNARSTRTTQTPSHHQRNKQCTCDNRKPDTRTSRECSVCERKPRFTPWIRRRNRQRRYGVLPLISRVNHANEPTQATETTSNKQNRSDFKRQRAVCAPGALAQNAQVTDAHASTKRHDATLHPTAQHRHEPRRRAHDITQLERDISAWQPRVARHSDAHVSREAHTGYSRATTQIAASARHHFAPQASSFVDRHTTSRTNRTRRDASVNTPTTKSLTKHCNCQQANNDRKHSVRRYTKRAG